MGTFAYMAWLVLTEPPESRWKLMPVGRRARVKRVAGLLLATGGGFLVAWIVMSLVSKA